MGIGSEMEEYGGGGTLIIHGNNPTPNTLNWQTALAKHGGRSSRKMPLAVAPLFNGFGDGGGRVTVRFWRTRGNLQFLLIILYVSILESECERWRLNKISRGSSRSKVDRVHVTEFQFQFHQTSCDGTRISWSWNSNENPNENPDENSKWIITIYLIKFLP